MIVMQILSGATTNIRNRYGYLMDNIRQQRIQFSLEAIHESSIYIYCLNGSKHHKMRVKRKQLLQQFYA